LRAALLARGDEVVEVSLRDPDAAAHACDGSDAVVNLAGESIAQRWTNEAKRRIAASRIDAPRALLERLRAAPRRPARYISASAVGYYGTSETETFTEASPPGSDFLATVCEGWEQQAQRAASFGMRVSVVRCGLVLGREGGALAKLLPVFLAGSGGVVASGRQWISWVHIDDAVALLLMCLGGADGVFNATAPEPLRNRDFTAALARAVRRPALIPVPEFGLKLLLGEGAAVLAQGQRVVPERTLGAGFRFAFPRIEPALAAIVR
jgi:uncharacterized protein (TIGR01777 family)